MLLPIDPDRVELEATHRVVLPATGHDLVMVRNGPHACAAIAAGNGSVSEGDFISASSRYLHLGPPVSY